MMNSVMIHEFGHCELMKAEQMSDGSIEAEQKANEYGCRNMPAALIPARYWEYRNFFLRSYATQVPWTEETCKAEFERWRTTQQG
jgi:hypothetical protein